MWDEYGMGFGMGWGLLWIILILVGIGLLVYVAIRLTVRPREPQPPVAPPAPPTGSAGLSARQILEMRYARGEIDTDEFLERMRALNGE